MMSTAGWHRPLNALFAGSEGWLSLSVSGGDTSQRPPLL